MVLDLFIGMDVSVSTDALVDVVLTIEKVEEQSSTKTIQITADTHENDWWGQSESYTELSYLVKFTNGYSKIYKKINDINIIK